MQIQKSEKTAGERIAEHLDFRKSEEDKRKVEAKLRRLARIAVAAIEPVPPIRLSAAEIERRSADQKRRLEERMKAAAQ